MVERSSQIRTGFKKTILEFNANLAESGEAAIGSDGDQRQTQGRVEFIDGAIGFDAEVGFGDALTTEKVGLAVVAAFGVEFHDGCIISRFGRVA